MVRSNSSSLTTAAATLVERHVWRFREIDPRVERHPLPSQLRQGGGADGRVSGCPRRAWFSPWTATFKTTRPKSRGFWTSSTQGYDVVSGWKKTRHDPWHKVYPSRVFNWLVSRLTGCRLHDHNCGFKLYRREVLREVGIYGELHRFIPVLAHARGFRVGEVEVRHRRRRHGSSKYGVSRFIKGFLDLLTVRFLTRFRERPLHMLGGVGLVLFWPGRAGHDFACRDVARSRQSAHRHSPFAILFDRTLAGRSPARDPGHPGRARHRVQHSHRRYLQHCRADSIQRKPVLIPVPLDSQPSTAFLIACSSHRPSCLAQVEQASACPDRRCSGDRSMEDFKQIQPRSEPRRLMAQLVIITATSLALGHCLRQPSQMGANDISRWCTVWSLLERGTYVIDDCPWQIETQDKVLREPKGSNRRSRT